MEISLFCSNNPSWGPMCIFIKQVKKHISYREKYDRRWTRVTGCGSSTPANSRSGRFVGLNCCRSRYEQTNFSVSTNFPKINSRMNPCSWQSRLTSVIPTNVMTHSSTSPTWLDTDWSSMIIVTAALGESPTIYFTPIQPTERSTSREKRSILWMVFWDLPWVP